MNSDSKDLTAGSGEAGARPISDLVANFGFQGSRMPVEQNMIAWREAMATLFDVSDFCWDGDKPFRADLDSFAMGSIVFGLARASSQRFSRTLDTIVRSGIDHVLIQLYSQGGFKGSAGEHPVEVQAGDICIFDLAQPLETRAVSFENLNLVVPRPLVASRFRQPEALHGLVLSHHNKKTTLLARHLWALHEFAPRMTYDDAKAVAEGSLSLVMACLVGEIEQRNNLTSAAGASSLVRIREYIDAQLGYSDLSADNIASHFGLSRASLYRLFAPLGGVADYIRSRRLHRAFFDLAVPAYGTVRISEVARRWCLGSEANFTRSFKSAYGITPRAARGMALLGGRPWQGTMAEIGEHQVLTKWMLEMAPRGKPP